MKKQTGTSRSFRTQKAIKVHSAEGRPAPRVVRVRVAGRLTERLNEAAALKAPSKAIG